jgi:hypothetical protein
MIRSNIYLKCHSHLIQPLTCANCNVFHSYLTFPDLKLFDYISEREILLLSHSLGIYHLKYKCSFLDRQPHHRGGRLRSCA